jgi:hypothetical protein
MELTSRNANPISWVIFLATLSVVLFSLISVLFPAAIISDSQDVRDLEQLGIPKAGPEPFEAGIWAGPLIISNVIVFGIYIMYIKERLPKPIVRVFDKIFKFEISRKAALISVVVLLAIYVAGSAYELTAEEDWGDYQGIKDKIQNQTLEQEFRSFDVPLKFFLLSASVSLFDNIRVIPFLASIALLVTTYLVTVKVSNKRFAGIAALVVVMQSSLFLTYDSSATYENFWCLFYLLSLYLMYRFWPLSPVSYVMSALSKPLTLVFLPMSVVFILRASLKKRRKILILSSYLLVVLISMAFVFSLGINISGREEGFDSKEFWMGFTSFAYQLRGDGLIMLFLLPLVFGLFVASRKNVKNAESVMVLILGMLLTAPFLTGFTTETNQPYRFVPLVVFFAMGVGVLLSKRQA